MFVIYIRTIVKIQSSTICSFFLLFEGNCCSIFEEGLGRVAEDNFKNCSTCDFHYFSDESGKTVKAYIVGSFLFKKIQI